MIKNEKSLKSSKLYFQLKSGKFFFAKYQSRKISEIVSFIRGISGQLKKCRFNKLHPGIFLLKEGLQVQLVAKLQHRCITWPTHFIRDTRELSTSRSGREGVACNVSSGKGGIVRREKSTVTRFFLADWQLSSSSPALRMTQAECLLSSFSL